MVALPSGRFSAITLSLFAIAASVLAFSASSPPSSSTLSRRSWISIAATAPFLPVSAALAFDCVAECIKECSLIAPGKVNEPYCRSNCENYCAAKAAEGDPSGKQDIVRQDTS